MLRLKRRSAATGLRAWLAFTMVVGLLAGTLGEIPVATAASHAIGSWTELELLDGDNNTNGVQLAPGLYVLSHTVVVPAGATLEGIADTAWDPELLFYDTTGSLTNNLCADDPTFERSAATICATGGGNGPGFSALSIPSGTATINNLTVTGADTNGKGGAINVASGATLNLSDAFIYANSADEGGGVYNSGTAIVRGSTFQSNAANRKGGGIENDGTLSLVNSTLTQNIGKGGGGLSTAGTAHLSFVTVHTNASTNKIGAGTLRNGGSLIVTNSIVANNLGSDGQFHDCSGTPNFVGVNLVSSSQGCNPGAQTIDLEVEGVALTLPGPGDFGGPTPTHPLDPTDPGAVFAIDAAESCEALTADPSATTIQKDQRGRDRVPPCDLGAYETTLELDISMSASASSVEVGAVSVPLDNLQAANVAAEEFGTTSSTQLSAIQLSAIQLSAIQLSAIQLSAINPEVANLLTAQLSAIQLSAIQLSAILTEALQLSAIQLSAIDLSQIQLSAISQYPEGTEIDDLLCDSTGSKDYCGVPLQALTFIELIQAEPDITLADVDFRATQLSAIQLSAIVIAQLPLEVLQLSAIDTENKDLWCDALGLDAAECDSLDMSDSLLELAAQPAYSDDTLNTAQLSAIQLSAIQLSAIGSLTPAQLSAIQLSAIQLSAINWASTQLSAIQLSAIQLSAIQLSAICASCDSSTDPTTTLGELAEAGLLTGSVGDLLQAFGSGPLANSEYTLADLLFGLIPPSTLAWEELSDLATLPLADASDNTGTTRDGIKQPSFDYEITIDVEGSTALVDIGLDLPDGFSFARADGTVPDPSVPYVRLDGAGDGSIVPTSYDATTTCLEGGDLVFTGLELTDGQHVLAVPVWAGVDLGAFEASVSACADAGAQSATAGPATASIVVTEGAPASGTILTDNIELAHIATSGETELYQFTLTGRNQARIILSNLGDDLDLVLFGPPLEAPLRGVPDVGYGFVDDFAYDLTPDDDVLDPNALQDLPLDAPPGQVLHAVAARRGTTDERIDTGALRAGTYTIQVSGYNGATTSSAYALRLRTTPLPDVQCPGSPGVLPTGGNAPIPNGINTVFLYNSSTYGDAGTLQSLLSDPGWGDTGITPALIAVDQDGAVAGELNAWAATPCDPLAANDVVRAIGASVLDPIVDANPDLEYVVIVGDDSQIPFARMTDGVFVSNEAVHGLTIAEVGQLKAALTEGYYQSDDPYGSSQGIAVADREFFVPELAVGRLVESATEIEGTINSYLSNGGLLTAPSPDNANGAALVTGYDFLSDGAQSVAAALDDAFSVSQLITESWTAAALDQALFPASPLSLASVNAHFDETRLLPANENLNGTDEVLFTVSDWLATLEQQPYHVFSMGCHAALSIPDSLLQHAVTDWAQAAAQTRTAWLGNTGYGYGDTEVVALSERLSSLYAERVGSMPIGKAAVAAKQTYVSALYTITPYDIKILEEFTLYGLPMSTLVTSPSFASAFAPAVAESDPAVFNDPYTGLESSQYSLNYADLAAGSLTPGAWTTAGYDLLTVQGRAVLPQETIDVSSTGRQVAGVLVTGLTSSEKTPFNPLIFDPQAGEQYTPGSPTGDSRTRTGELTFPASITSEVRHGLSDDGLVRDRVVVVPARHYTETGSDELEVFTNIELQTLYRPDGWDGSVAKPFIERSVGRYGSDVVHFDITIRPATGNSVDRALVLFREKDASGSWLSVDLASAPGSDQWLGGRPRPTGSSATAFEYVVMAVSNLGDVAIATGKAINFDTVSPELAQGVTVTVDTGDRDQATGWYRGQDGADVIALATSASPLCSYVLDGAESNTIQASGLIPIEGDGGHLLQVFAGADCANPDKQGLLFVAIDGTPPESQIAVDGSGSGAITVTLTAFDPFGSGVESIEYKLVPEGSEPPGAYTTYSGPFVLDQSTTILFRAVDFVGNAEAERSDFVEIDTTGPTVDVTATTADGGAYLSDTWTNQAVTVDMLASDPSGVASLTATIDGADTPLPVTLTAEGSHTIAYTATDNFGNQTTATFTVKIDKTPPEATLSLSGNVLTGGEATATFSCDDLLSGVESCVVTVDGEILSDGPSSGTVSLPTSVTGAIPIVVVTAADNAGNEFSKEDSYAVTYGYCYLYDPDKATSGAVAIKIRITTNTYDVVCDGTEDNISAKNLMVYAFRVDGAAAEPQDAGQANSDPTLEFRYDPKLKGYIYNLTTEGFTGTQPHVLDFTVGQDPTDSASFPDGTGLIRYPARFVYKA